MITYNELMNLIDFAIWHKANCNDSECGCSMFLLRIIIDKIINNDLLLCTWTEKDKIRVKMASIEWI